MDSCGQRHVMLFLSLWASFQFLKQILSLFWCAVNDSRRMGRACRGVWLFYSSPLHPVYRALISFSKYWWATWYARRCNDFLQEPSLAFCLWESKCRVSVTLDEKGSGLHLFHNHILLVLHSRIFLWPLFAWALGRKICLFLYLCNYEYKFDCSVSFSSVCKATEKCNVLNAAFLLTSYFSATIVDYIYCFALCTKINL